MTPKEMIKQLEYDITECFSCKEVAEQMRMGSCINNFIELTELKTTEKVKQEERQRIRKEIEKIFNFNLHKINNQKIEDNNDYFLNCKKEVLALLSKEKK